MFTFLSPATTRSTGRARRRKERPSRPCFLAVEAYRAPADDRYAELGAIAPQR